MTDTIEVATFGEALAVFRAQAGVPLGAATEFTRGVAGAEVNLAIALARLGHRVSWSGRLGADAHGDLVRKTLLAEGVATGGIVVDREAPTGLMVRDVMRGRPIEVLYHRANSAGSRLRPEDLDLAAIAASRVLAVSGVTAALSGSASEAVFAAVHAARDAGVLVLVDPNIRMKVAPLEAQLPGLRRLCKLADVVVAGQDEAAAISGLTDDEDAIGRWFLDRGARRVVIKNGARGCWATDGRRALRQPAFPVHPVDPVGAGDAFAAGYLSGVLRGDPLEQCLRRGAACGAMGVAVAGDYEGLPNAVGLERFLAGGRDIYR